MLAPRAKDDISVGADGKFHGPGVSDNGSGLAALLAIARAIKVSPEMEELRAEPVLIGNVGEEGEGNLTGMRWLCKSDLRPRDRHISGARRRRHRPHHHPRSRQPALRSHLHRTGRPQLERLRRRQSRARAQPRRGVFFRGEAERRRRGRPFNVGLIDGGTSINSIPSLARAKVDIRSESNEKMEELVDCSTPPSSARRSRRTSAPPAARWRPRSRRSATRPPRSSTSRRRC